MFETKHFRITETEIQLLRSRFPYKKVPFEQLTKAELTAGCKIKYPTRTLLFGSLLIIVSTTVLFGLGEFQFPKLGEQNDPRGALIPWL